MPKAFPGHPEPDASQLVGDIAKAAIFRPELRRIELTIEKAQIDRRLAKNNLLPNIDIGLQVNPGSGSKDIEGRIEFKVPLQRREAKGRLESIDAQIERLGNDKKFARDRIAADVRDSYSAIIAAYDQLKQTRLNVDLSQQLEDAETERLKQGATDLLALQIREQATFDAKVLDVEAQAEYFRAQANYRAAIAADAPTSSTRR